MQRAGSFQEKTAISAGTFAQLDAQVELTLHNFTVIPPPAISEEPAACSAAPLAHVDAALPSSDAPVAAAATQTWSASGAAAVVPVLKEDAVTVAQLSASAPLVQHDGARDCESPEANEGSGRQAQAMRARDRKADENAVIAAQAQEEEAALLALAQRVAECLPPHTVLPPDTCKQLLTLPLPVLRERLKQLGLSPASRSRISSLVIIEVARRREAANAFDVEIQKRARGFYSERVAALLAAAKQSLPALASAAGVQ